MPRLKLTVAYEGTRYEGWQMQAARKGGRPRTIQGELERAVGAVIGRRAAIHGAGRTDGGVHAEAQVCHVDVPAEGAAVDWMRAVNVQLDADIRVLAAEWADDRFHARKSAVGKRYAYTLWQGRHKAPPRLQAFVWSCPELDWDRIAPVIPRLVGERDFASFQNGGAKLTHTVRSLRTIEVLPGRAASLVCPPDWPVVTVLFEGNGFLKQMVRNLMGLLVWAGQGKIAAPDVPAILAAVSRGALPSPSAPARGLTLLEVLY